MDRFGAGVRAFGDDFRLVSEDALREGVRDLLLDETVVMEGACAAGVAAMRQMPDEVRGETVVLPVSGRNIDTEKLRRALAVGG
jgi:threonine dehydratase